MGADDRRRVRWLTHDIDSSGGLGNLVNQFLPLEASVGARPNNVH
jgi:hypothetical protein